MNTTLQDVLRWFKPEVLAVWLLAANGAIAAIVWCLVTRRKRTKTLLRTVLTSLLCGFLLALIVAPTIIGGPPYFFVPAFAVLISCVIDPAWRNQDFQLALMALAGITIAASVVWFAVGQVFRVLSEKPPAR